MNRPFLFFSQNLDSILKETQNLGTLSGYV